MEDRQQESSFGDEGLALPRAFSSTGRLVIGQSAADARHRGSEARFSGVRPFGATEPPCPTPPKTIRFPRFLLALGMEGNKARGRSRACPVQLRLERLHHRHTAPEKLALGGPAHGFQF